MNFLRHKDIRYLFQIVNQELENTNQWSISNKLSPNIKKAKYLFFHKPSQKQNIPLLLPKLIINNYQIQRTGSIKFLQVLLDENLSWKEHIKYNENKIAKNLGLLFKAKHYLNKRSLLVLYYSFIHTYINYGNIAWGSTNRTNFKKINSLQKHAIRIIHCKDRFAHARELFQESKILNVFQLNILNNLVFMHKIKSQTAPKIFQNKFRKPTHKYPTNFSTSNYSIPPFKLSKSKYRISIRGIMEKPSYKL